MAAFAQPALGADGTAGRNIVEGPGYRNVDLGLFRDIRLGGDLMLQLRAEATNVFNFVNLNNPGLSLNAPATFGKIRTARDMRRIQLGARAVVLSRRRSGRRRRGVPPIGPPFRFSRARPSATETAPSATSPAQRAVMLHQHEQRDTAPTVTVQARVAVEEERVAEQHQEHELGRRPPPAARRRARRRTMRR